LATQIRFERFFICNTTATEDFQVVCFESDAHGIVLLLGTPLSSVGRNAPPYIGAALGQNGAR